MQPVFVRAYVLIRLGREFDLEILKPEYFQGIHNEIYDTFYLVDNLFPQAEYMRIVLGEPAHPQEAMQHARFLISIDRTHLKISYRQVLIASRLRPVYQDVRRAVHWFYRIFLPLDLEDIHILFVVPVVSRLYPDIGLEHMWPDDKLVSAL